MSALPADVTELLAAIRDAVNVPLASFDPADEREYERITRYRMVSVGAVADLVLKYGSTAGAAASIRARIAETPITYTPYTPAGKDTGAADQADAGESTQPEAGPTACTATLRGACRRETDGGGECPTGACAVAVAAVWPETAPDDAPVTYTPLQPAAAQSPNVPAGGAA